MLAAALLATPAAAQQAKEPTGAIDGTVVDSSGVGVPGVEVFLFGARRGVRTAETGAYRMDSVEAGPHIVRFRRLGLQPTTLTVYVAPNDVTGIDVVMPVMAHTLETVTVQDSTGEILRLPKGFLDRMHGGQGAYFTAAEIERNHPIRTSDVVRKVPGIYVSQDGVALSARGHTSILSADCAGDPMPLYVDGAPMLSDDLNLIPPSDIAGIEVYRGPSTVPPELRRAGPVCGAIVIWTKH